LTTVYAIHHDTPAIGGDFLVRRYTIRGKPPGSGNTFWEDVGRAATLEGARALVPAGMQREERREGEDVRLLEHWL